MQNKNSLIIERHNKLDVSKYNTKFQWKKFQQIFYLKCYEMVVQNSKGDIGQNKSSAIFFAK